MAAVTAKSAGISQSTQQQGAVIDCLRSRLVSPFASDLPLRPSLQSVHDELKSIIERALSDGACSSILLLGEHGVGKTLVVERAIASISALHNNGSDKTMGVVRLSGHLHLEDRVAFQETARQLCGEFKQPFSKTATYDENLLFLRGMLQELHKCMKTVVFVLDEFEKFARRSKQVLLYNLLDVLQHSKVQAVVIGVTCSQDVMEHMEKRVKSRFSHLKVTATTFMSVDEIKPPKGSSGPVAGQPPLEVSLPDTPLGVLKDLFSLPSSGTSIKHSCSPLMAQKHNQSVSQALASAAVKDALRILYHQSLRPSDLVNIALSSLLQWTAELERNPDSMLSGVHVLAAIKLQLGASNGQADVIAGLSVLQLFLLVAMYRLETKNQMVFNFEMLYDEYRSVRVSSREQFDFQRPAALRAFQELIRSGLVMYVDQRAEQKGRLLAYVGVQLHLVRSDLEEGMQKHPSCPELLIRFFKQEC